MKRRTFPTSDNLTVSDCIDRRVVSGRTLRQGRSVLKRQDSDRAFVGRSHVVPPLHMLCRRGSESPGAYCPLAGDAEFFRAAESLLSAGQCHFLDTLPLRPHCGPRGVNRERLDAVWPCGANGRLRPARPRARPRALRSTLRGLPVACERRHSGQLMSRAFCDSRSVIIKCGLWALRCGARGRGLPGGLRAGPHVP